MKTTNFEISKQLKDYGWHIDNMENKPTYPLSSYAFKKSYIKAYDLETLLDALPDSIIREYKSKEDGEVREFRERLIIEKNEICYSCDDIENADDANRYYQEYGYMQDISLFKKFNDNSLADTAGKMWLLLKEKERR